MQDEIARHNYGWSTREYDFFNYLKLSSIRYFKAYSFFIENEKNQSLCDVGGFFGVFPITMKTLGYTVTMTESLKFYSAAFDQLFNHISGTGVEIINYDPFDNNPLPLIKFDFLTLMAILEHYPHSPKTFMCNVISMIQPNGYIYIESPNFAVWGNRKALLKGRSPLPSIEAKFKSEIPFIGHHHEYTMNHLKTLACLSKLKVIRETHFNYSGYNLLQKIKHPCRTLLQLYFPQTREVIGILTQKEDI